VTALTALTLNLRRSGSQVLAELSCHVCQGFGTVEGHDGLETSCPADCKSGVITRATTDADWDADWWQTVSPFSGTDLERDLNMLVQALEDEANGAHVAAYERAVYACTDCPQHYDAAHFPKDGRCWACGNDVVKRQAVAA